MLTRPSNCEGCPLNPIASGFMVSTGSGSNGVLLVGEALGEAEADAGKPFVGKSGSTLDKMLARGGMARDDFWVSNTIFCRPPDNKLTGMYYAAEAIEHCMPNLDSDIYRMVPRVIVTLGVTAFKRVIPEIANQWGVGLLDSKKHKGARGYVFYSDKYKCWVIPTVHPAFVVRGKTAWSQVIIHDIQRATEIARDGYKYDVVDYTLDPAPYAALKWVDNFELYYKGHPGTILSCDIETPHKDANEEELDVEDGQDYIILRCGYSYMDFHGMSIPWGGPYKMIHERLMAHPCDKVFWNAPFDVPRVLASED